MTTAIELAVFDRGRMSVFWDKGHWRIQPVTSVHWLARKGLATVVRDGRRAQRRYTELGMDQLSDLLIEALTQ